MFQVLSWHTTDAKREEDDGEGDEDDGEGDEDDRRKSDFLIKMFGVTSEGESVSATVHGFPPFFYFKVPASFRANDRVVYRVIPEVVRQLAPKCGVRGGIIDATPVKKKDFWGFKGGRSEPFVRVTLRRHSDMRAMANHMARNKVRINGSFHRLELYESNIDPLLRFIHVRNLSSAGWIRIPADRYERGCDFLPAKPTVHKDVSACWKDVHPVTDREEIAPLLVASFDIECNSSNGDFPVATKTYRRLAVDLVAVFDDKMQPAQYTEYEAKRDLAKCVRHALGCRLPEDGDDVHEKLGDLVATVSFKRPELAQRPGFADKIRQKINACVDDLYSALRGRWVSSDSADPPPHLASPSHMGGNEATADNKATAVSRITSLTKVFSSNGFPELKGDEVIQIGTTFHIYGHTDCCYRHILTLGSCEPVTDSNIPTHTVSCDSESDLLLAWTEMICATDPDIVTGYNIFGFDMAYMYERAKQLGVDRDFLTLGRLKGVGAEYKESNLSSSALGDNVLKHIVMHGRVTVDLMKEVLKGHKLTSYKLNDVAFHFTKQHKNDVSPADIFRLQRGSAHDRMIIASYCLQDCALCNRLVIKLELVANNLGMANVCSVPLSFIFMRGQGVKIFSLVARQCRLENYLIPTKQKPFPEKDANKEEIDAAGPAATADDEEGYEGAIVLEPKAGMYLDDPVTVLDYASLYPSSMISENISHDCLVLEPKYDDLPGVEYVTIKYDTPSGECACRFAQPVEKGVLPRILQQLLKQRKATRKRVAYVVGVDAATGEEVSGLPCDAPPEEPSEPSEREYVMDEAGKARCCVPGSVRAKYGDFQKAVLDGLQNAYKVTANSLYGQMGAATSPLYLKHVAACTTATGRSLILKAKDFMEKELGANIIYGDTDSLFIIFDQHVTDAEGRRVKLQGRDALRHAIEQAHEASRRFKPYLKPPHDLEYDKTFWPFMIFSKKRYVGNLYEDDIDKCTQKSMGIALKRRDNAPIVKQVYGGIIDIILNKRDVAASVAFLKERLGELAQGLTPLESLVVTKTLKAVYKDPERIAHHVLAQRIGERDPGNKPQINDRVPYVYIQTRREEGGKKKLQGECIEDPTYVLQKKLRPDYEFYITNQIMKPVLQTFSIVLEDIERLERCERPAHYWDELRVKIEEETEKACALSATDAAVRVKARNKYDKKREAAVKELLFDPFLRKIAVGRDNMREITHYFQRTAKQKNIASEPDAETEVDEQTPKPDTPNLNNPSGLNRRAEDDRKAADDRKTADDRKASTSTANDDFVNYERMLAAGKETSNTCDVRQVSCRVSPKSAKPGSENLEAVKKKYKQQQRKLDFYLNPPRFT